MENFIIILEELGQEKNPMFLTKTVPRMCSPTIVYHFVSGNMLKKKNHITLLSTYCRILFYIYFNISIYIIAIWKIISSMLTLLCSRKPKPLHEGDKNCSYVVHLLLRTKTFRNSLFCFH